MTPEDRTRALDRLRVTVQESESSPIRRMKKIMEERPDMLSLAMGEASFEPPQELVEAASRAMSSGKNLYTSTNGTPGVREAVSRFIRRHWQAEVDPETDLLMTVGGMEALYLAARVLVEPGDRVLLPDPGWGMVRVVMERLGAELDFYPLKADPAWQIDPDEILARLEGGPGEGDVKVLVVNSPSNPTGAVLGREGWRRVLQATGERGIFVVSDEVYHNYVYDGEHSGVLNFAGELGGPHPHVVAVNSFSKSFAVTGWRLGWTVAHPSVIKQMGVYKESVSLCSYSVGQHAMAEFLDQSAAYLASVHALCRGNMIKVVERLDRVPGLRCAMPAGGFYAFPDCRSVEASCQLLTEQLLLAGIAVVPGGFFGEQGRGCLRLGIAAPWQEIEPSLARLEAAFAGRP
jgi:aspartate/methionine/tyrosine aminotransferase